MILFYFCLGFCFCFCFFTQSTVCCFKLFRDMFFFLSNTAILMPYSITLRTFLYRNGFFSSPLAYTRPPQVSAAEQFSCSFFSFLLVVSISLSVSVSHCFTFSLSHRFISFNVAVVSKRSGLKIKKKKTNFFDCITSP